MSRKLDKYIIFFLTGLILIAFVVSFPKLVFIAVGGLFLIIGMSMKRKKPSEREITNAQHCINDMLRIWFNRLLTGKFQTVT